MADEPWLVLDVNNLAWRAYHTTGELQQDGRPTGVLYGVLRALRGLTLTFPDVRFAFCFDSARNFRRERWSWYKSGRALPADAGPLLLVRQQLRELEALLRDLGYANVFAADGYEADDLIARCVEAVPAEGRALVVSSDHDLYQLLRPSRPRVTQYLPVRKYEYTPEELSASFQGISPMGWNKVLALAGCATDGVPGVAGVGPTFAARYLTGRLAHSTRAWQAITEFTTTPQYQDNLACVTLPYEGCPALTLRPDVALSPLEWNDAMETLGMPTLAMSTRRGMDRRGRP